MSISRTAQSSAFAAFFGLVTTSVSRCGRSLYAPSSTRLGSTRMRRTWSGVQRMSIDVTSELMQLDLPAPVAPAMSTCGSVARSSITDLPSMSRPRPTASVGVACLRLGRGEHVAERDELALPVRHLDADRAAPRDRGEDAHVGRRHRVLDVVAQAGDPVDLHAGPELELVAA